MSFTTNPEGQSLIQGTIDAVSQTVDITSPNSGTSVIQITGTWVGSIVVEGSNDSTNWSPISSVNSDSKLFQPAITESGSYVSPTNGFKLLRLISDSWTSGTASISVHGADAASVVRTDTTIRGSSGNIAEVDIRGNQLIKVGESNQLDIWGRIRTSLPTTLFELNFNFNDRPLSMHTLLETGGTSTYDYNTSGVNMAVTTASGSRVIRQTRRYFRYITGKGVNVFTTSVCEPAKAGLVQEWGFFDDNDGMFVRYDNDGLKAVVRSSTSGSPVDIVIDQADWNLDKMDGTGPSGFVLDPAKYNVWIVDFAWQGAGGVRFGIYNNAEVIYFHQYKPSNDLEAPFTRIAVLPVRYEIRNESATASASTMYQGTLGIVVDDSGNLSEAAVQFSASRGVSLKSIGTTFTPLLAIRPKLTFNGNENRVPIRVDDLEVTSETQVIQYQIIKNATLTGASFNSVSDHSAMEFDIAATSYTGGEKISEGYVLANSQGNRVNSGSATQAISKLNYLGLNIQGTEAENIVIVARTITSTSNSLAVIGWEEFQ